MLNSDECIFVAAERYISYLGIVTINVTSLWSNPCSEKRSPPAKKHIPRTRTKKVRIVIRWRNDMPDVTATYVVCSESNRLLRVSDQILKHLYWTYAKTVQFLVHTSWGRWSETYERILAHTCTALTAITISTLVRRALKLWSTGKEPKLTYCSAYIDVEEYPIVDEIWLTILALSKPAFVPPIRRASSRVDRSWSWERNPRFSQTMEDCMSHLYKRNHGHDADCWKNRFVFQEEFAETYR